MLLREHASNTTYDMNDLFALEAHNLAGHGARAPRLLFMLVVKNEGACCAAAAQGEAATRYFDSHPTRLPRPTAYPSSSTLRVSTPTSELFPAVQGTATVGPDRGIKVDDCHATNPSRRCR